MKRYTVRVLGQDVALCSWSNCEQEAKPYRPPYRGEEELRLFCTHHGVIATRVGWLVINDV